MIYKYSEDNNFLSKVTFSSGYLEETIRSFELTFPKDRDENVEWNIAFPSFITSFYQYVENFQTIPSQLDFWRYYVDINHESLTEHSKDTLKALKARMYRGYPSFVRDIHFNLVGREMFSEDMIYDINLDMESGVDSLLRAGNIFYGFELYVNTLNSLQSRTIKKSRPKIAYKNIIMNAIPLDRSKTVGHFNLYEVHSILKRWKDE